jgi:hypothetical protein
MQSRSFPHAALHVVFPEFLSEQFPGPVAAAVAGRDLLHTKAAEFLTIDSSVEESSPAK